MDPVISLTLGAGAVTPIELASAYSSFATNGTLAPPYLIEKIEDSKGELIYRHITSQRVSIPDPAAAVAVRKTLELAAQYGTGTRAVLDDRPIAGKTGTHQGFREAWFIGFIPQYTSSVWIGFAEEQLPLTDVEINGELVSSVSGGRVPAPIRVPTIFIYFCRCPRLCLALVVPASGYGDGSRTGGRMVAHNYRTNCFFYSYAQLNRRERGFAPIPKTISK